MSVPAGRAGGSEAGAARPSPSAARLFTVGCGSLLALVGCASAGGARFPTSDTFPSAPRAPPSLATEVLLSPRAFVGAEPAPATDGDTSAPASGDAVGERSLVRRVPADPEAARALVLAFFSAMVAEAREELLLLFSTQAFVVSESSRQLASPFWSARLAQLDYGALRGELLLDRTSLRLYTEETVERARADGAPLPRAGEAVVVVNPGFIWSGRPRLLGDSLAFRLRPRKADARFEITEVTEDFRLP